MVAAANAALDRLNNQLQQRIVGDRIRTRLNNPQLMTSARRAVLNGSTWSVLQVRGDGLWVESTDGRGRMLLPTAYLEQAHRGHRAGHSRARVGVHGPFRAGPHRGPDHHGGR